MASNPDAAPRTQRTLDPIAVEPLVSILSLAITSIGVAHQLGWLTRRNDEMAQKFRRLRDEILRLHNCLDDLILALQRYSHYEDPRHLGYGDITDRKPTLSDSLMDLRDGDYLRWRDLERKIHELGQSIYQLVSDIRSVAHERGEDLVTEAMNKQVFAPIDALILNLGEMTLGELAQGLRTALEKLDSTLVELSQKG